MPIDINTETLVRLSEAPQYMPIKPHRNTLERWWRSGCRGVQLETVLLGGFRYTSVQAIDRFFAAINAAAPGAGSQAFIDRERQARIAAADKILDDAGVVEKPPRKRKRRD